MSVTAWRGIRFARAERFRAPELVSLEQVPEPGGSFGAAPIQPAGFDLGAPMSEDCHFLNVWAPAEAAGLPVLLYFYGGGFERGAASLDFLDGEALAEEVGCVVVTANHRVGALGFASLAHRSGALSEATNLGVRDARAALEWVARNIAAFGGDPAAITIAGQSSGGFIATATAVAPCAAAVRGLVTFSGAASRVVPESIAREMGEHLLEVLGIENDPERILDLPAETIIAAQPSVIATDIGERNSRTPRAYGVAMDPASPDPIVPVHPLERIRGAALARAVVLAAATTDEIEGFRASSGAPESRAALDAEIERAAGDLAPALQARYADPDLWDARQRYLSDYIYRLPAVRTAEAQRLAGGVGHVLDIGRDGGEPALHGSERCAVFAHGETDRDHEITSLLGKAIRGEGLGDDIIEVGERPSGVVPSAELVDLWKGVARP